MANVANPSPMMQKKTPQDRLFYLDALRGTAIFFIVWLHASAYTHHEVTLPVARIFLKLIDPGLAFFFLADGFLLARHVSRQQGFLYADYLRKSAWRLLLPWLVFTLLYGLLRAVLESVGFFATHLLIGYSFTDILIILFNSSVAMQMYFLMSLFLIRTLYPLTRFLAIKGCVSALLATIVYILVLKLSSFQLGSDPITGAIAGFQYYLLGILYFHLDGSFRRHAPIIAAVWLLGYGIMAARELKGLLPVSARVVAKLTGMTANYAIYLLLAQRMGLLVKLGQHTMVIYLLHPVLAFAFTLTAGRIVTDPLALHLVVTVSSIIGSLAIGWLVFRIPKGRIIFGENTARA